MKFVKYLAICLSAVILAAISLKGYEHVSAKEAQKISPSLSSKSIKPAVGASLISSINNTLDKEPDGIDAAVSLVDLDSGKEYDAGQSTTLYKAASCAKVLAAIDYLHEVETGLASLNQEIDGVNAQILLQQMIEVSDDDSWTDINNYLGNQQQSYASQIGLSSFTGGEYNTMTASDMAKLLAMFYQGKLLNTDDRSLLLNYMSNTTSTNLIQAVLPAGAVVYHKYGQLWGYLNDAAIVSYQKHSYVLVVFTNNPDGTADEYNDQVNLIQTISQLVFTNIINAKL